MQQHGMLHEGSQGRARDGADLVILDAMSNCTVVPLGEGPQKVVPASAG